MRDIRASDEVKKLIGVEALRELEGDAYERYDCWRCGGPGRTTQPTTVVVLGYRATPIVEFAHAQCAKSQIVQLDVDRPTDLESFDFNDMRSKAAVMEYATPPRFRALLVLEPRVEMAGMDPGGERVNLWISELIEAGLTLMRTGGQLPEKAPGWRLQLEVNDNATLTTPDGTILYEGPCTVWEDWFDVVTEVGGCIVLVGTVGLYAVTDDEMTTLKFHQLLNRAARSGSLVGGIVPTSLS
jgi:hypothetical protein